MAEPSDNRTGGVTRRAVLGSGVATAAVASGSGLAPLTAQPPAAAPEEQPQMASVAIEVNGERRTLNLDTRTTLLDALREHLNLTGTKKGCDHGQCGACTVIADGERINSCLSLAVMHDGGKVTTIEGLGTPDKLHPMQAMFVEMDGYQCGYCTPGQICSAVAMIDEVKRDVPSYAADDLTAPATLNYDEMRERMSGNICRCGAYSNIIGAITEVVIHGSGGDA